MAAIYWFPAILIGIGILKFVIASNYRSEKETELQNLSQKIQQLDRIINNFNNKWKS